MPYTLRTRTAVHVTNRPLLLACASDIAARTGADAPTGPDDALRLVLTDDVAGDVTTAPDDYGLTISATATLLTADSGQTGTHWLDDPFGHVSGRSLAHLIDADLDADAGPR